jgi:hypothetical protein
MKRLMRGCVVGVCSLSMISVCNADSIWKQGSNGFGAGPAAAIFSISSGAVGPSSSTETQIYYFSASNCEPDSILNDIFATGSFIFHNPQIVQADARSIYNIGSALLGSDISSVTGIMVDPFVFVRVGGRPHCFPVTCASGQCSYNAPATPVPVSLI